MIDAQAYVLRETGVIPELERIQVDDRLEIGQVLLRVSYSGLCATQLEEIYVSSRNKEYMPHLFGHEGVGVIEAVGPGVTTKEVGEACVIHWRKSSFGMDANPGNYWKESQRINAGPVVSFSDYVVVPENRLTPLPPSVPADQGSLLGCAFSTGWGAVSKSGQGSNRDHVVVIGIGGVGLAALETGLRIGCQKVSVLDPNKSVPQSLADRGTRQFDSFQDLVEELGHPSLIVDTSGEVRLIQGILELSPNTTRIVLVGMPKNGERLGVDTQKLLDGLVLKGSNGGEVDHGAEIHEIASVLTESDFQSQGLQISMVEKHGLEEAIELHRSHAFRRVILKL